MLALRAENLFHTYETTNALNGLSLDIPKGALFGLLGPNGSGKTTLFRIISTLLKPNQGQCFVFDQDVTQFPDAIRQQIGMVFQQPALDLALTIRQNLQLHGGLYGLKGAALSERIEECLRLLGLTDRQQDRCKNLSGGLLRRADLARGILHKPQFLLLDEPTNGLDPVARHEFWQLVQQLKNEGLTILVATHLMEEAALCDELAIVFQGKCVANGTPESLCNALGHQTLWLDVENIETAKIQLETALSLHSEVMGNQLCIQHEVPQTLLPEIYRLLDTQILSASIRKPTLEDVFFVKTLTKYEV